MSSSADARDQVPSFLRSLADWIDGLPHFVRIALMVGGFVLFWPIGLTVLAYLIWSGKMGCGRKNRYSAWGRMGGSNGASWNSSGNAAFDEYRDATLKQLEEDQREFNLFIEQLRRAKDQRQFDDFMAERMRKRTAENGTDKMPE